MTTDTHDPAERLATRIASALMVFLGLVFILFGITRPSLPYVIVYTLAGVAWFVGAYLAWRRTT